MLSSTVFKKGRIPWNKGIKYTRMLGNKHNFQGENRSNRQFRWEAHNLLKHINKCSVCNCEKKTLKNGRHNLITHHKDENIRNNDLSNLQKMCRSCHIKHHHKDILAAKLKKYAIRK